MSETYLTLSVGGLPPFSSRGCRQELKPIETAETHRTVNGELVTTTTPLHHKYKTIIKGKDQLPAALDSMWKGQDVKVGCIQYLWQKAEGKKVLLNREPIKGSLVAINELRKKVKIQSIQDKEVELAEPGFVGYRPRLYMKLVDFGYETEEWGNSEITWYMKLEEL